MQHRPVTCHAPNTTEYSVHVYVHSVLDTGIIAIPVPVHVCTCTGIAILVLQYTCVRTRVWHRHHELQHTRVLYWCLCYMYVYTCTYTCTYSYQYSSATGIRVLQYTCIVLQNTYTCRHVHLYRHTYQYWIQYRYTCTRVYTCTYRCSFNTIALLACYIHVLQSQWSGIFYFLLYNSCYSSTGIAIWP